MTILEINVRYGTRGWFGRAVGTVAASLTDGKRSSVASVASNGSRSGQPMSVGNTAPAAAATHRLVTALRDMLSDLFGTTLLLNSSSVEAMFPTAFERLGTSFYRSKVTSWMAAQEEDYRWVSFVHLLILPVDVHSLQLLIMFQVSPDGLDI